MENKSRVRARLKWDEACVMMMVHEKGEHSVGRGQGGLYTGKALHARGIGRGDAGDQRATLVGVQRERERLPPGPAQLRSVPPILTGHQGAADR